LDLGQPQIISPDSIGERKREREREIPYLEDETRQEILNDFHEKLNEYVNLIKLCNFLHLNDKNDSNQKLK
jgi:hypothetical protein